MFESSSNISDGNLIAAIQQTHANLQAALKAKDWEQIPVLDEVLRAQILIAVEQVTHPEAKLALQGQMQEIQAFYQTLIELGTAHRNNLAQELQQVRKSSSAVNQYLKSSFDQR